MTTTPFHFGPDDRRLYGVFHPAVGTGRTGRGVVLCNPFPHEAVRTHRAYRIIADALTRQRCHVLRFDYYGTGDSAGEPEEIALAQWPADIHLAMDELKAVTGVSRVYLLGMRASAPMVARAARGRDDVAGLLLWEPVVDGAAYARALHDEGKPLTDTHREVRGWPIHLDNFATLDSLDLRELLRDEARPVKIVASKRHSEQAMLNGLADGSARRSLGWVADADPWVADSEFGVAPVPSEATRLITAWLEPSAQVVS